MCFDIDPTLGTVGGSIWGRAPFIDDPEFGRSRNVVPIINRIDVDSRKKLVAQMGALAKATFFPNHPAFAFNVCFAVGEFSLILRPGKYADPHSHWFNVFMGYYQIDAPKKTWNRPFGYESNQPGAAVNFDDVMRLGKSDWNYFSNYMYGVPEDCIAPYNTIPTTLPCRFLRRETIGNRHWDLIELEEVEVVSGYQSDAPNARRLVNNSILSPVWRRTFGLPSPRPDFPTSFIGTKLLGQIYMSFSEDADNYHTVLFGGTVNKSFPAALNERFLGLQMKACREVIVHHYPRLGFPI